MARIITCDTLDGREVEFSDEIIGSGALKNVYFSPDRSYVVAVYKTQQDAATKERVETITTRYRESIFGGVGGAYWEKLFCWPTAMIEESGWIGIVAPAYQKQFMFDYGSKDNDFLGIKGREKEGKWFASANNRNRFLDPRERGDWRNYLKACVELARAVRRMHAAGLAHSDLSYRNVLIDPTRGNACVIDIDGLVVPGKFPPDVVGTPDFIAPEVVMTQHLPRQDPNRKLPSIATDRHALAVLIYMYLLYRHPLRGGKVHDAEDDLRDESLTMGERALFIEHPDDPSNRIKLAQAKPTELPWADTDRIPFTFTGPYLEPLFRRAFIDGLSNSAARPTADEWETALVKTVDLVIPCRNGECEQKWYVFDNSTRPRCPFCGTEFLGTLPILNLYSSRDAGQYRSDNYRLPVFDGQALFPWHANRLIAPNEKLTDSQRQPLGSFQLRGGRWHLLNRNLPDLMDGATRTAVPIGGSLELTDGQQILLSRDEGGRLVIVQMVEVG